MIIEAVQHFLFKAPKHIKALGYVRENIAIDARYKRCKQSWESHLDNCKSQIMTVVHALPPGSDVLILGSGALYDVPVNDILELGHNLTCLDIVQNPMLTKKYPAVTFIEKDITGIAEDFCCQISRKKPYSGKFAFNWSFQKTPALVVSLNLLSQLPLAMKQFAENQNVLLSERFSDNIMSAHLSWLLSLKTKMLLVTDMERNYYFKGKIARSEPALPNLDFMNKQVPDTNWIWNIAPEGEADKDIRIEHKVGCWHNL